MSNSLPIAIFKYNWTNSGSMAWEFAAPLPHSATVPTRTMTYDDDNRLATFNGSSVTSDLDGNLTSAPLTNSTFFSYAYDARNRLLNAGGVTNAYDAMNNRIGQTVGTNTTIFVVNPNAKLPQVLMRIKNGVTNYYIYGAGLLYQITETATAINTLTYHYDYRGSTIALSADSGAVTDRVEYSAYGLTTYKAGNSDTPFLFNGRYGVMTDPNGLLYMRARYYNPYLCRFLNPDPSGFTGGLNFYAYANGNPVSYLDPFGLSGWSATGRFLEGAAIGAGVTAVVILAAPEIAAGGAAALVWAGVSEATATTVATATVSGGLYVAGGYGAYNTTVNTAQNAGIASVTGNWDPVAFNVGTVAGGTLVGVTPGIVGESSGGRTLTDSLHDLMGQPPSAAPNTWNLGDVLQYEVDNAYNPSLGAPGVNYWATSPTPFSSGFTATGIAGGVGSWITPSIGSSSSQSSSTGK